MAVVLSISVPDIAAVMASFNVIKVKRSVTVVGGPYTDLTRLTPRAASLQPPLSSPYIVSGKTLQIAIDSGDPVDIVFSGSDPLTAAQLVSQFNTALGATIAAEVLGQLVLTSTLVGTASEIRIVGGNAASVFGWPAGTKDIGEDAHVQLVADQELYSYVDNDGLAGYFYKAQFLNTTTSLVSVDSAPFQGEAGVVVGAGSLSNAQVNLIDGSGVALEGQEITFYGVDEVFTVEGRQIPLTRKPLTIVTDNAGHAEIDLVRGSKWKVVFEGTSFVREFTVPDATSFNLMTVLGSAPDPFKIVELQFPAAPRRTI